MTACGSDRPDRCSSSRTSSKLPESDPPGVQTGSSGARSPSSSLASVPSRAAIQLRLPRTVLISPLWATIRNGCASGQDGNVFVEKRECTSAISEAYRGSDRSAKNGSSWPVVSMPLYARVRADSEAKYRPCSRSARLRNRYARRSSSTPESSRDGSATTSWRNTGMDARAVGPTRSAVTTTSRHARTSSFSSAAIDSIAETALRCSVSSTGRNAMPIA